MKLKKLLIPTIVASSLFVVPFAVTSCSKSLPTGEINREQQAELLSSDPAKIALLDNWITTTFTSLYVSNVKSDATTEEQEQIGNTIQYYLNYLNWPTTSSGSLDDYPNSPVVDFAPTSLFSQIDESNFENLVQNAYKFYISYMSIVSQSSSDSSSDSSSTTSPETYFFVKVNEWKKDKYKTIVKVTDASGQILNISNFNPSWNYTGCDSTGKIIENDYKILMSTRGTLVYQNVMKMLLANMYFLHSTEQQIKNGTNYNKMTKNPSSVNYINTTAYVGENNDFSTFLLKKYMVENTPQFTWSYSSDDYTYETMNSGIVSTMKQFNNIKTTKETTLSDEICPNSNENDQNSLTSLQAFSSLTINPSDEDLKGDLSISIDDIKSYGSPKIGLLDSSSNILYNFTELDAIKRALEHNQSSKDLMLPSINIKKSSISKSSHSITMDDIEVLWNGSQSSSEDTATGLFEFISGAISQKLTINSISYQPSQDNDKQIKIAFTYSFTLDGQEYSFDSSIEIINWGSDETAETNPLKTSYVFSGDPNNVGIKIFDGSNPTGITYYLRVLPLFKKENQKYINKNWYMSGKFTLEGTPWETEKEQTKLVYFFILNDSNLYSKIQDFYLFNNFNVKGSATEITQLISSLGLTKKTDADRRAQGII